MSKFIAVLIVFFIGIAFAIIFEIKRAKKLSKYWSRTDTEEAWVSHFPSATREQICEFLELFADSFVFMSSRRLNFSPDDRVMDIYRASNPVKNWPDSDELEYLEMEIDSKYGIKLSSIWNTEITLGEIFERIAIENHKHEIDSAGKSLH